MPNRHHTPMTARPTDRILTLDFLRGVAVMGILLMNIISFAMPSSAYLNPLAWGTPSEADKATWLINFILVDAKFRALFSLMFGASMLLFIDRAEAASADSAKALHFRRMGWLAMFGLLHYGLLWYGDILFLYAIAGMIAWRWRNRDASALVTRAAIFIGAGFLFWVGIVAGLAIFIHMANAPGADPQMALDAADALAGLGAPGHPDIADEAAILRSSYGDIVYDRVVTDAVGPLALLIAYGAETLGLMALGMALFRNGFLTGEWTRDAYIRAARIGYGIGITGMVGLAIWCVASGYDTLTVGGSVAAWSTPFRVPIAIGHAAVAILIFKSGLWPRLTERIVAAGQVAFSNYIGCSLVMTTLFYGYGFGLFGEVSRTAVYGFVIAAWIVMLLWSKPWMTKYRHGPLEWLWRCLTQVRLVPLKL
jgi:uncharacterized protein